ncbi:MAG: glycosyltransferase family 39 protein [Candidatus Sungbacteria bacterium]|nr:glycosyltransferase family 39 protein [Candidatus Sungbacteria bacterium]
MNKMAFILLCFILLLGAFFRFYHITEAPPGLYPDEAMNGNNALEAIATGDFKWFYPENNGREGLFINIQALSIWFFGNEPWALRLISAIFGTLTILGVYLLTKELFSNKISKSEYLISKPHHQNFDSFPAAPNKLAEKMFAIQEISHLSPDDNNGSSQNLVRGKQSQNPNVKNGFRDSKLEIRDYRGEVIALLSSFFLATSFWHINFSRIGFRAIMVPFLATFGLYFLLKGLRTGKISSLVAAGVFIGLGFHTYIAFRFMPFVIAVPIIWYLWKWRKNKNQKNFLQTTNYKLQTKSCAPCAIALFLFITFIVALPIGYYFLQHPEDFVGRGGQVSIFAADSPLYEFAKSNALTWQMFFWKGDCNWRHNLACRPELHPLMGLFFMIGIIMAIRRLINPKSEIRNPKQIQNPNDQNSKLFENWKLKIENYQPAFPYLLLISWLVFMSLPATLTKEGLPHALRAIGMIPPVMILAGLGAWTIAAWILGWLDRQKEKWPKNFGQIVRIQLELTVLFALIPLWIPNTTFKDYFFRWASHPETYFSFATDLWHLGKYLNGLPPDTDKYVVVNMNGTEVRGIPMPAQTVMFATDTFRQEKRIEKNIRYIPYYRGETSILDTIEISPQQKTVIALLDGHDREVKEKIREKFPNMKFKAPGDFVIFTNTE